MRVYTGFHRDPARNGKLGTALDVGPPYGMNLVGALPEELASIVLCLPSVPVPQIVLASEREWGCMSTFAAQLAGA